MLREYGVGDQAEADVVTPIPLIVFDPVRTEALRHAEGRTVPPVFRLLRSVSARAEDSLRQEFMAQQAGFTRELQGAFRHPVPLLTVEFQSARFHETVDSYRQRHAGFPLTASLSELWAFGNTGDAVLEGWLARLRRLTNELSRAEVLPGGESLTADSVRLVSVDDLDRPLTLAAVDQSAREIPRASLLSIAKVRQDALRGVPAEERELVQFLAGHLQPSCVFDGPLTRQARARRTEAINATDRYEAGQVIVAQGESVTPKIKLALDELRARTVADRAQAAVTAERTARSQAEAEMAVARRTVLAARRLNRWLLGGLAAAAAAGVGAWMLGRRGRFRAGPVPDAGPDAASLSLVRYGAMEATTDGVDWRQRALAAEATAQKATALLRSNLLSHMARWMMGEFLQRLLSQRAVILTSHERAEREVADLALRLDQLHAPLEERLRAYEKRIAELEAELAAKGEQNVELIKAKIESTRKHLEDERAQEPLNWN